MRFIKHLVATASAISLALTTLSPAYGTTFFEVKKTCPVGGEKFKAYDIGSSTSWGQRPDGREYGTLPIWPLIVCPKNGFVIFDDEFSKDELKKLTEAVSSPEYKVMVQNDEARHFRAWWLATKIDRPLRQRVGLLMQASWDSDDIPERKQRYQQEFATLSAQLDLNKSTDTENFWLSLRGANALRELGKFENAMDRILLLKAAPSYPTEVDEKEGADLLIDGLSSLVKDRNAFNEPTNLVPKNIAEKRCSQTNLLYGVELEACHKIAAGVGDQQEKYEADEASSARAAAAAAGAAAAAEGAAAAAMEAAKDAERASRKAKRKKSKEND